MTEEEFLLRKPFAGEAKPSMLRRRVGHDYGGRCIYLVTVTIEGRRPLLGTLVGDADAPDGSPAAPRVEPTILGERVRASWMANESIYPGVSVLATCLMPDHLHGILFFREEGGSSLGQVMRGFKAACNREYRQLFPEEAAERGKHCRGAASRTGGRAGTGCLQSQQGGGEQAAGEQSAGVLPPVGCAATPWQPQCGQPAGVLPPVGCAATPWQPQCEPPEAGAFARERRFLFPRREEQPPKPPDPGLLWSPGYNDHILEGPGALDRWYAYLRDNPRRLAIRRAHPDFFRVTFNVTVAGRTYAAIGNRFLLTYPQRRQVQCSRSLTDEQVAAAVGEALAAARGGTILVSPAISAGEQAVMRAALDAQLPLIFLTPWGFTSFSKPGHQYYEACAEGRFLILAPWPHINQRIALTRAMCLQLNAMAKEICEEGEDSTGC